MNVPRLGVAVIFVLLFVGENHSILFADFLFSFLFSMVRLSNYIPRKRETGKLLEK